MTGIRRILWWSYWPVTAMLLAGGVVLLFAYTPTEQQMGPIQKIFYVHMPSAVCALLACLAVFVASVGYLWRREMAWDALAASAARTAVLLASIALVTGMIWSRYSWGPWWTFTSWRLTFTLVLWLLYVVYLMVRSSIESRDRRALVAAVYGIIAFVDVPLVYLSARMFRDFAHPARIGLEDVRMKLTLAYWFLPILLVAVGLTVRGFVRSCRRQGPA